MTDLDKVLEAVTRNAEAAARLQIAADRLTPGTTNGGNVTFSVNTGGIGLWIAVTSAVVALVALLVAVLLYVDLSRKVDRVTDYQTATYMIAPQLKPKEPNP